MTLLKYMIFFTHLPGLQTSNSFFGFQEGYTLPKMEVVKFVNLDFQMWAAKWIGSLRCEDVTWHVWHVALICSWRMFGKWQMVNGWFGLVVCRTSGKDCWPSSIENPRQMRGQILYQLTDHVSFVLTMLLPAYTNLKARVMHCRGVSWAKDPSWRLVLRSWDLEHTPEVPRQRLCNRWRSWESMLKHRRLVGFLPRCAVLAEVQHEASGWPSFHFVHLVECREPKIQVGYAPPGEHHSLLPAIAPLRSYLCHNAGMYFHLSHVLYIYTSSSRASRWRKFQKKKEPYSRERICL